MPEDDHNPNQLQGHPETASGNIYPSSIYHQGSSVFSIPKVLITIALSSIWHIRDPTHLLSFDVELLKMKIIHQSVNMFNVKNWHVSTIYHVRKISHSAMAEAIYKSSRHGCGNVKVLARSCHHR